MSKESYNTREEIREIIHILKVTEEERFLSCNNVARKEKDNFDKGYAHGERAAHYLMMIKLQSLISKIDERYLKEGF